MEELPKKLSLSEINRERSELVKDYITFSSAYDLIRKRILESSELAPPRNPKLHEWSGSRAICGSLELAIHAIERTIVEFGNLISKVEAGEIENSDRPVFTVIDGDKR